MPPFAAILSVLCECLGAAAIGYGLWLIWAPLCWLWIGVAAFGLSKSLEHKL